MAIINHKNISTFGFDEDALTTFTSGELVINFGDLTTTGDLANGIFAGADDVTIRHFGSVETSGLGAAGIFVHGDNARIENFGSVHTSGDFFGNLEFFSEGIFAEGDRYYISNYGSVRVEGEFSSALVGIGADGLIINFGAVNSLDTGSIVIGAVGDRSQVINLGQVAVIGESSPALQVTGEDASAVNRGQIVVTGDLNDGISAGPLANEHITNQGIIRITGDDSWGMIGGGDGAQISNFGVIETDGTFAAGIVAIGSCRAGLLLPGQDFEIVNAGRIVTNGDLAFGVSLGLGDRGFDHAVDGQIVNSGLIKTEGDGAAGIVMIGNGHHLTNSGRISTDGDDFADVLRAAGVVVSGDNALVENTRIGVIESKNAASAAVELNVVERDGLTNADTSSHLENFGLIKGAAVAVLGAAGQELVVNHGRIVGDVVLGDGADTFVVGKGGTLTGNLFLGGGDDLVRIEQGSGTTHIADFVAGATNDDIIDVSEFFSNLTVLKAHSQQSGDDVVISLDHNDQLVLVGVHLSALNIGDFLFV